MSKQDLKIIFVDDHPMILEGYRISLSNCDEYNLEITTSDNIDEAYKIIELQKEENTPFDIAFFDLSMPPSLEFDINNGEQLALVVRKTSPSTQIAFLTMHDDQYRMNQIIKDIEPDGIIIKSDVSSNTLKKALSEIINFPPFYSNILKEKLNSSTRSDISINKLDIEILYNLSQGVLMKNLHRHIDLSQRAIENRKRKIKKLFNLKEESDFAIIKEAKDRGFL